MLRRIFDRAPGAGFDPATNRLTGDCSTAELSRNVLKNQAFVENLHFIQRYVKM